MYSLSFAVPRRTVLASSRFLGVLGLLAALPAKAFAGKPPVYTGLFSNLAVGGYDSVAYFTQGRPVKGSRQFQSDYNGAVWRFASAENLARFEADPEAFAPQYGGYCAWAAAQGYTAPGDPEYWAIVDGRLFLNYDAEVEARWRQDIQAFIEAADRNWPTVLSN